MKGVTDPLAPGTPFDEIGELLCTLIDREETLRMRLMRCRPERVKVLSACRRAKGKDMDSMALW